MLVVDIMNLVMVMQVMVMQEMISMVVHRVIYMVAHVVSLMATPIDTHIYTNGYNFVNGHLHDDPHKFAI